MGSRGGARTDGLLISAEGPEELGRPGEESGAQGPGASLQGPEEGQNRGKEKLHATEEPSKCKDRSGKGSVDLSLIHI